MLCALFECTAPAVAPLGVAWFSTTAGGSVRWLHPITEASVVRGGRASSRCRRRAPGDCAGVLVALGGLCASWGAGARRHCGLVVARRHHLRWRRCWVVVARRGVNTTRLLGALGSWRPLYVGAGVTHRRRGVMALCCRHCDTAHLRAALGPSPCAATWSGWRSRAASWAPCPRAWRGVACGHAARCCLVDTVRKRGALGVPIPMCVVVSRGALLAPLTPRWWWWRTVAPAFGRGMRMLVGITRLCATLGPHPCDNVVGGSNSAPCSPWCWLRASRGVRVAPVSCACARRCGPR
jgi:hypothetical protein